MSPVATTGAWVPTPGQIASRAPPNRWRRCLSGGRCRRCGETPAVHPRRSARVATCCEPLAVEVSQRRASSGRWGSSTRYNRSSAICSPTRSANGERPLSTLSAASTLATTLMNRRRHGRGEHDRQVFARGVWSHRAARWPALSIPSRRDRRQARRAATQHRRRSRSAFPSPSVASGWAPTEQLPCSDCTQMPVLDARADWDQPSLQAATRTPEMRGSADKHRRSRSIAAAILSASLTRSTAVSLRSRPGESAPSGSASPWWGVGFAERHVATGSSECVGLHIGVQRAGRSEPWRPSSMTRTPIAAVRPERSDSTSPLYARHCGGAPCRHAYLDLFVAPDLLAHPLGKLSQLVSVELPSFRSRAVTPWELHGRVQGAAHAQ